MNKDQSSPPQTIGGLPVRYVDFGFPETSGPPIRFITFREAKQKMADKAAKDFSNHLNSLGIPGKLIKK